jgi:phosphoenolpyruvate synthase/pyruvate phosphate dikinase
MTDLNKYGGKGASLIKLKEAGFPVPEFVVFTEQELTSLDINSILKRIDEELNADYFAVRSSANLEDGELQSFAGIFHTELYVDTTHLAAAIQKVRNSKKTETVQAYLKQNKLNQEQLQLAIVVQEMVPAQVSGVAFGIDPAKPYRKSKLVSAVFGLGEGLVSGHLNADHYEYRDGNWQKTIVAKEQELVHQNGILGYVEVAKEKQNLASLSDEQLDELGQTLTQLEVLYKAPQDVEFCYVHNQLFVLQSRPITAIKTFKAHVIWDNSNIIESYPGITLPFTFSFILAIYESVYKNFAVLLGVPKNQIEANSEVFAEMLGHIKGRVYYQLVNWYKALAMLPAYSINTAYMEKMMGVSEPLGIAFTLKAQPSKLKSYWYVFKTIVKIARLNYRLPKVKRQFTEKVNSIINQYKKKDYSQSSTAQIWEDYHAFKKLLVNEWWPPLANDLLAMVYFGTLQKLCTNWLNQPHLHTQLIAGKYPVKSVLPAQMIDKIVNLALQEELLAKIKSIPEDEIWQLCQNNQLGETGKLILSYIQLYGDRSVGELKFENETFTQNPLAFITILKSYSLIEQLHKPAESPNIKGLTKELSFLKKRVFKHVANKAAQLVADRENLRFDRTFGFGTIRMFLWYLGKHWEQEKVLVAFEDIFYLKENEINDLVLGKLSGEQVKTIVTERKKEFEAYKNSPNLPARIHQWDDELDVYEKQEVLDGQMSGIPCCSGLVTAKVRILSNPNEVQSLEGDILVTTSTDPGWITIFQSASAILVERGSTLSHAAIVCREMGIPCIVGIKGITQLLKNGDTVKMNGQTGIIEKLNE